MWFFRLVKLECHIGHLGKGQKRWTEASTGTPSWYLAPAVFQASVDGLLVVVARIPVRVWAENWGRLEGKDYI